MKLSYVDGMLLYTCNKEFRNAHDNYKSHYNEPSEIIAVIYRFRQAKKRSSHLLFFSNLITVLPNK